MEKREERLWREKRRRFKGSCSDGAERSVWCRSIVLIIVRSDDDVTVTFDYALFEVIAL